ncbi:SMI1/KNR4 family protein [Sulfurovum sp. TSL1]|uniref:SMI1/KNR4 family protein n=1 Tax=Sulfurovum sp. TSL1 TaxID=2826994 RepID=UPI001CC82872|nr:SMI1/KNR4 family protein [Sulfurovum sp. TSL1]GIT97923.1 hypothetical protein TSL1_07440 [Sulfurovum sp. TSL1]
MKNKIIKPNPHGEIDMDKLERFERKIGTKLPKDYREYLIKYNGCEFENKNFYSTLHEIDYIHIHEINGLIDEPKWASLENSYEIYNEDAYENGFNFKKDYLAIMSDDGGNQVVIKLSEPFRGSIYFWNHDDIDDTFIKISDSYTKFIDSLINDEEYMEILKVSDPETYTDLTEIIDRRFIDIYQYKNETFYFVPYSEVRNSYNMQPHAPVLSHKVQQLDSAKRFSEVFKETMSFSRSNLTQKECDTICKNTVFPLNKDKNFKSDASLVSVFTNDGINYDICSTKLDKDGEYYSGPSYIVPIDASDTELYEAFKKAMNKSIELNKK